ncbi:hypothetical protein J4E91_007739 [Alternaria rosae]|nr:hypothetical protein J4E91_007739 [Alternaria rosae]
MAESTSLASWKLHSRFVDIVRSDASLILDLISSYHTLEYDYIETENIIALRMGKYGDSEILARLNGSVSKRVIRDSNIRKAGTVLAVLVAYQNGTVDEYQLVEKEDLERRRSFKFRTLLVRKKRDW